MRSENEEKEEDNEARCQENDLVRLLWRAAAYGLKRLRLPRAQTELQADDTTSTSKRSSRTGFKRRTEEGLFLPGAFKGERSVRGLTASPAYSCRRGRCVTSNWLATGG